jgi:hypothetical protein
VGVGPKVGVRVAVGAFTDANRTSLIEPGETGVGGVTVFADTVVLNGQPDAGEPTAMTGPDGSFTLTGVPEGVQTICALTPTGLDHTSPRCQRASVAAEGTVSDLPFGFIPRPSSCPAGVLTHTVRSVRVDVYDFFEDDPAANGVIGPAPANRLGEAGLRAQHIVQDYHRPTDLPGPAAGGAWGGSRLWLRPYNQAPITYVQNDERLANAIFVSGIDATLHPNLVLKITYARGPQRLIQVVSGESQAAVPTSPASGWNLPAPASVGSAFSFFDKNGELHVYNLPRQAGDPSRYQDLYLITEVMGTQGSFTVSAGVAGKIDAAGKLVPVGGVCGDQSAQTIFVGTTAINLGALPLDDVPDAYRPSEDGHLENMYPY